MATFTAMRYQQIIWHTYAFLPEKDLPKYILNYTTVTLQSHIGEKSQPEGFGDRS